MENIRSADFEIKSNVITSRDNDSLEWSDDDDTLWSEIPLATSADVDKDKGTGDATSRSTSGSPHMKRAKMKHNINSSSSRPLSAFRSRYLWVSDVMSQLWCEQQMHYRFTQPATIVTEKPEMLKGTDMHLARELEVQDSIPVKVQSDVDIFAIKLLNLYIAVTAFLTGEPVRREIPIFGAPFEHDVFMIGLIDEIRVDPETFDWEIVELKTRKRNVVPSKAQKQAHQLQVMLYKVLFDDLVSGKTSKELLERHLKLDFDKELGPDVIKHLKSSSLECRALSGLWEALKETMQPVPRLSQMLIEYCWQEDRSTIALEVCQYEEQWLRGKLTECLEYWTGARDVVGVDIEDAWKCQTCDFADVCEWRVKKADEHRRKNAINC